MADSRSSKKDIFEDAELRRVAESMYTDEEFPSPTPLWYRVIMFSLILLGLGWIIVFYISQSVFPIPGIGNWNITIGLGLVMVGLLMTTRWR